MCLPFVREGGGNFFLATPALQHFIITSVIRSIAGVNYNVVRVVARAETAPSTYAWKKVVKPNTRVSGRQHSAIKDSTCTKLDAKSNLKKSKSKKLCRERHFHVLEAFLEKRTYKVK